MSLLTRRWTAPVIPAALLAATLAVGGTFASVRAQADAAAHPAHIHVGTCDNLGDVAVPLSEVTLPVTAPTGPTTAIPVEISDTFVPMAVEDILAGGYAINVHASADNIEEYIACGDIGGALENGRLIIGLDELNASGHSGVAALIAVQGGTDVSIFLTEDEAAQAFDEAAATPGVGGMTEEATPAAADDMGGMDMGATPGAAEGMAGGMDATPAGAGGTGTAEESAVSIVNFSFDPATVTVPVGGTVSWTNNDGVPHTATASDRSVFQSGTLNSGDTFTHTFESAGTFDYFCEFHANMRGTIVVE